MFMHLRKCLVSAKYNSLCINKSDVAFSRSLLQFISTSTKKQDVTSISVSEFSLRKYDFSPEAATQFASVLTHLKNPENFNSIVSFLKDSGFSNTQLEKILKYMPRLLSSNLEIVIKPKVKIFQDFGFSSEDTAEIITNDPDILYRSLKNRVIPSLTVLKDLLGSTAEIANLLKVSGWFLKCNIGKSLPLNVLFLKSCGLEVKQINWLMYNFPRTFLRKPEHMRDFVAKIDEMGIRRSSKMFVHAIRVLSSMTEETWELKLKTFQDLGFSKDDIAAAFRKSPQVFAASEEKMKKLKEVLEASGKYDVLCIINYPTSLICSIEKTYKPRLFVLRILEEKNLIKEWPSFPALYKTPSARFYVKYVAPYLDEVGELHKIENSFSDKR